MSFEGGRHRQRAPRLQIVGRSRNRRRGGAPPPPAQEEQRRRFVALPNTGDATRDSEEDTSHSATTTQLFRGNRGRRPFLRRLRRLAVLFAIAFLASRSMTVNYRFFLLSSSSSETDPGSSYYDAYNAGGGAATLRRRGRRDYDDGSGRGVDSTGGRRMPTPQQPPMLPSLSERGMSGGGGDGASAADSSGRLGFGGGVGLVDRVGGDGGGAFGVSSGGSGAGLRTGKAEETTKVTTRRIPAAEVFSAAGGDLGSGNREAGAMSPPRLETLTTGGGEISSSQRRGGGVFSYGEEEKAAAFPRSASEMSEGGRVGVDRSFSFLGNAVHYGDGEGGPHQLEDMRKPMESSAIDLLPPPSLSRKDGDRNDDEVENDAIAWRHAHYNGAMERFGGSGMGGNTVDRLPEVANKGQNVAWRHADYDGAVKRFAGVGLDNDLQLQKDRLKEEQEEKDPRLFDLRTGVGAGHKYGGWNEVDDAAAIEAGQNRLVNDGRPLQTRLRDVEKEKAWKQLHREKEGGETKHLRFSPYRENQDTAASEAVKRGDGRGAAADIDHSSPLGHHGIAGLSCVDHGGPLDDGSGGASISEMIYWQDVPSDATFRSPHYERIHRETQAAREQLFAYEIHTVERKYLTFEPDDAGFNNMRMGLEIALVIAAATGRTLVLPPKRQIALLVDKSRGRVFSYNDFFPLNLLSEEYASIDIISMEEFLQREAITGHLRSIDADAPLVPPGNRTAWDSVRLDPLWSYLRKAALVRNWNPKRCVVAFPAASSDAGNAALSDLLDGILNQKDGRPKPTHLHFQGKPVPVDAPAVERLREILAGREELCLYDDETRQSPVLHFKVDESDKSRLLGHFYGSIFFEDWKTSLWSKRLVRDHLRYRDEIVCAAARVVRAVRERARRRGAITASNGDGAYDAFHVRRHDFQAQYSATDLSAEEIVEQTRDLLRPNATVYIATDEQDRNFFKSFEASYDVCYLDDFLPMLSGLNRNYFGMVDQLVAARARIFIGSYFSSFSGYINRLRGYYSVKEERDGYHSGVLDSYYFPKKLQNEMRIYKAVRSPFFAREFPIAWRDIDKGIVE